MNANVKKLIAGNWKLNLGPSSAARFFEELQQLELSSSADWLIFPSALSLESASRGAAVCGVSVGVQNFFWQPQGAFTGENSLLFARELGASWALIGHSERRQIFSEKEDVLSRKLEFAISCRFHTIFCVGETLEEREKGLTESVLRHQLGLLRNLYSSSNSQDLRQVLAYEPVWAIGTGKVATLEQIQETHRFIAQTCRELLGFSPAILYGGSVTPDNSRQILQIEAVDGVLVGGASTKPDSFAKLF